jgi:hypothetical protein
LVPEDEVSVAPEPEELVGEPWVVVTPEALAALELGCISLPLETVPAVAELPLMLPALVPVELQAARPMAITTAIAAPWIVFIAFSWLD